MARRNVRPSVASSHYPSQSPMPGNSSDIENQDPQAMPRDKGKGRAADFATPSSEENSETARGQKRKRLEVRASRPQENGATGEGEDESTKYYDPNQDPEERRDVKRKSRALEKEFNESRDDLLRNAGDGLYRTVDKANEVFRDVKQTGDATVDSRLLVNVSDVAYKKTAQLVLGDTSTGVDIDEFLSKCITFMREGGPSNEEEEQGQSSTQRRRHTRNRDDSEDEEEDDPIGEILDWEFLGRQICIPFNSRPPVPSFLLGPLSVEKKQRAQTQRRARHGRDNLGREARPEALNREDLTQSDENGLTARCIKLRNDLVEHCNNAMARIENSGFTDGEQLKTPNGQALLRKCRVTETGGPSLFDYAVNPHSFGQTVENLFYISFLIKEGSIGIQPDSDGLPTIIPAEIPTHEERRSGNLHRHQAVFSIDYGTWQDLIKGFNIREPLIEHREEEAAAQIGQRGWYS